MQNKKNSRKDEVRPKGKWDFNQEVTLVFDDMLERSIPDYRNMRALVTKSILMFQQSNSTVLDLGCSTGGAISGALEMSDSTVCFLGVEVSSPMREMAEQRLQRFIDLKRVSIIDCDLRTNFPTTKNSVVLSVLTLQFIPIEYRQKIVSQVFQSLNPGGAFILVEKILGNHFIGNSFLERLYYEMKGENGYTDEQIRLKRKSLEGVLVPVTSQWNEQLLTNSGFKNIQKFWQQLNFAGWIGFKSE